MSAFAHAAVALDFAQALGAVGMDEDEWMVKFLRSQHPRRAICAGRQVGKTAASSLLAACTGMYVPRSLTLVISPSERTSRDVVDRVRGHVEDLGAWSDVAERDSAIRIQLKNRSRVVALPGSETAARGWPAHLILIDEAAKVHPDTFPAARGAVAVTGGALVVMSTPGPLNHPFAEIWNSGDWERYHLRTADCPRADQEHLAHERATLPPWLFAQEYEAVFSRDGERVVYPDHLIEAAFTPRVRPFEADWPRWGL